MENGKTRVVVGLSGGVDSSVAAYLLKEQGYDVVGLFMRNWHDTAGTLEGDCPWYDDQVFAELVARRLDIPFHFVDLSEQYRARVVDYMFAEYGRGRTPNPDVLCNREIKFDAFLEEALKLGADYVVNIRNENVVEAVKRLNGGKGVDYVLECSAAPDAVN
ncbi:MAG: zinc-binding dehydrogenase, partial [Tidjanibacter sp.]|nr:zinc-binding dehydrogenase [Tidjanibacter sp.]